MSQQSFEDVWNQFVKWSQTQLDQDRTIILPNFMSIYSKSNNQSEQDRSKFVQLQLHENFLFQNNLKFLSPMEQKYPQVKVNYAQIAKVLSLDKDLVYHILADLFAEIQDVLLSGQELELALHTFGK